MKETRQLAQMEGSPIYELFKAIDDRHDYLVYEYQNPISGRVGGPKFAQERTLERIDMLIESIEELAAVDLYGEADAWQLYADQLKDNIFELLNNK